MLVNVVFRFEPIVTGSCEPQKGLGNDHRDEARNQRWGIEVVYRKRTWRSANEHIQRKNERMIEKSGDAAASRDAFSS
jgi:hypothetical protein